MEQKRWRGHALRYGRYSENGAVYVVTGVTHGRVPLFESFTAARILVKEFYRQPDDAETWAYVVMPDHFHWMFQLGSAGLSELVQRVKSCSARHINQLNQSSGPVWQHGFHDQLVRDEDHFLNAARYIVANPLRARLVTRLGDYPLWDAKWL